MLSCRRPRLDILFKLHTILVSRNKTDRKRRPWRGTHGDFVSETALAGWRDARRGSTGRRRLCRWTAHLGRRGGRRAGRPATGTVLRRGTGTMRARGARQRNALAETLRATRRLRVGGVDAHAGSHLGAGDSHSSANIFFTLWIRRRSVGRCTFASCRIRWFASRTAGML